MLNGTCVGVGMHAVQVTEHAMRQYPLCELTSVLASFRVCQVMQV